MVGIFTLFHASELLRCQGTLNSATLVRSISLSRTSEIYKTSPQDSFVLKSRRKSVGSFTLFLLRCSTGDCTIVSLYFHLSVYSIIIYSGKLFFFSLENFFSLDNFFFTSQSNIGKVFRRYHHSPGSHQSSRLTSTHSVTHSVSDSVTPITSRASCDAKNPKNQQTNPMFQKYKR